MKSSWAQPSLSRDFAILSAAILFVLFLITVWFAYSSYEAHVERIELELEHESVRIERALARELGDANYLLLSLGKQIVLDEQQNLVRIARMLKSFDNKGSPYSILGWVSTDQKVVVSSNYGVLETPVDLSDRAYLHEASVEPWKMMIGERTEGRVSGQWIIPLGMGITDNTGKFVGSVIVSMDIAALSKRLRDTLKHDHMSFAILSKKDNIPIFEIADDTDFVRNYFPSEKLILTGDANSHSGLLERSHLPWGAINYPYYRVSAAYPYIILLSYDAGYSDQNFRDMLLTRLTQLFLMGLFLLIALWVMRVRMIKPVIRMTEIAASVAHGKPYTEQPGGGPMEITGLAAEISRISDYIQENKRIEDELRNKMFVLKDAKEQSEIDRKAKSEFLAYVCQEMRNPLNNIIGFAQVMRDQLYGPIENRKYRQYTADIYETGNVMLQHLQELMVVSKAETGYIKLSEHPVDIGNLVRRAQRFIVDKLQAHGATIKIDIPDALPRLMSDEFRLQEAIINIISYIMEHAASHQQLSLSASLIGDSKEKLFLALVISSAPPHLSLLPAKLAERAMTRAEQFAEAPASPDTNSSLSIELARLLIMLHKGHLHIERNDDGEITCLVLFPGSRLVIDGL